jgi:small subunit ribosomal protein S16
MLAIRMRRQGAKKRPFFRVVVIDSHAAREGRALDTLGHYNPTTVPETFKMNHQRLEHWLTRGAQPSDTLRTLLTRHPAGETAEVATSATPPARPVPVVADSAVEVPDLATAADTVGDGVKTTGASSGDEVAEG